MTATVAAVQVVIETGGFEMSRSDSGRLGIRWMTLLALSAVLVALGVPAAQSSDGPVSLWAFEGDLLDSVGSNHGSPIGDVTFSTDHAPVRGSTQSVRLGNVALYEHDYVLVANHPSLDVAPDAAMTIAMWVKVRAEGWAFYRDWYHLIGKRNGCEWMNYQLAADSVLHFNAGWGGEPYRLDAWGFPSGLPRDRWVHLAVTYDGDAGALVMYIDGSEVARADGYVLDAVNDAPVTIGDSGEGCPFRGTPGLIDDVRFYDRALTPDEIAVLATPQFLPTTKDECTNGGWRAFPEFRNQGDCVSYVVTHGGNPPANG